MNHSTVSLPNAACARRHTARALSFAGLATLTGLAALAALPAVASAQTPGVNLGLGFAMRLENSTNYDGGEPLGQARLIVNAFLDSDAAGPYVLSLEQGGTVLATGACDSNALIYSGHEQEGVRVLRECSTDNVPTARMRTDAPVSVVIALVDDATDARTELYRGQFPVFASYWWDRNDGDRAIHIEHRGLRLDSFFGAAFIRQYMSDQLLFSYADSASAGDALRDESFRCRVGEGEWRVYEGSLSAAFEQNVRNRVWLDGTVHEDGAETLITRFYRFNTRSFPVAVQGSSVPPSAGSSMDGTWTCELRSGTAGARVVAREFRFDVQGGYIRRNAVESQVAAGRNSVIASVGLNAAAMPAAFDPALVRGAIAGRPLTGATAPVVSALPARATNPSFTAPRAAAAPRGGAAPRGRGRGR